MVRLVFPFTLLAALSAASLLSAQQQIPVSARPGATAHRQNQSIRGNPTPTSALPANPPGQASSRVVFRDGLLTIHAHNANLAEVLNAIQRKTGASFEFPSSAAQEPVAVDLGPASPHDVLASLLNGSRFDYIVLGRPDDPNDIATVMLQEKTGANGVPNSATEPQVAGNSAGNQQPAADMQENADDVPTEIPDDTQQAPEPAAAPEQQQQQQQPKTPEQMLEELKRMQQQQQIQQQQGQQPNQQPNQPGVPQQFPPQTQQPVPNQAPFPQQPYPQQQQPQPQQSPQDDSEPQPH